MINKLVAIIGLCSSIMLYGIEARFYNNTRSVLKIKINVAQKIDEEITLAAGERKIVDVGNYLTNWVREYTITAIVAANDDDGSVQEIQLSTIKHNKLGNIECAVFCIKETTGSNNQKTEKLTFYCVKQEPEKSAEFIRPKRSITKSSAWVNKSNSN